MILITEPETNSEIDLKFDLKFESDEEEEK